MDYVFVCVYLVADHERALKLAVLLVLLSIRYWESLWLNLRLSVQGTVH